MSPKKQGKRAELTEVRQVAKCLRQRLSWCNRTGQTYDPNQEQYSIYPRAIADDDGCIRKGVKAVWKDKNSKRYSDTHMGVILNTLPLGWVPDMVVMDGMFLINCKPLRNTTTISDYAMLLFNRFFAPYFQTNSTKEIHLVFDAPNQQPFNPKAFEQRRRDQGRNTNSNHEHIHFTPSTKTPSNWREHIDCRQCKKSLIEAITLPYLQSIRFRLKADQVLVVSGCYSANHPPCFISGDGSLPSTANHLKTTSEEADLRIWRHVYQSNMLNILVYSPDTDVYNIGLTTVFRDLTKRVIVQINTPQSQTRLYVHVNNLISALVNDPDLAPTHKLHLPQIFQML